MYMFPVPGLPPPQPQNVMTPHDNNGDEDLDGDVQGHQGAHTRHHRVTWGSRESQTK